MKKEYRQKIVESRDSKCQICENPNPNCLDVHHLIPKSKGGNNSKYNLIVLCSNCHRKVHGGEIDLINELSNFFKEIGEEPEDLNENV